MKTLTESGTLPIGVEFNGETHREYEIREQLVGDMIDVFDDPASADRAAKNNYFLGICVLARMITRIGGIPKEEITPALLMQMHQDDMNELKMAEVRLDAKRKSFRAET